MHKLEVKTPAAVQLALKHEGAHSPQARFVHRLHCLVLVGMGWSCYQVAKVFGDDPRSIERWVHELQHHGVDGLRERPHSGRHASLDEAQMQGLAAVLASGPRNLGYAADAWSADLLRNEIARRFGVALSVRHCRRLFCRLQKSLPRSSD